METNLRRDLLLLSFSLFCYCGLWLYTNRVLVPYQVADAALHNHPRGNFSDLFPRWLGARELLLHGRDPYSPEVTREIQAGYYGRVLDPAREGDPKDKQGFAYPAYVVFLLAPTVRLSFPVVQRIFFWLLFALMLATVPVWFHVLRWRVSRLSLLSAIVLTCGSLPVIQGLKLQQITLLVFALIGFAMALFVRGNWSAAGIVLALATVKPQLVCPLLLWLVIWTSADVKQRYRWLVSFVITLAILIIGAEIVLSHWIMRFWYAVRDYADYTNAATLLHQLIPHSLSWILNVLAGISGLYFCWRSRRDEATSPHFILTTVMVLAITLLLIPFLALYNQIMLLPAVLLIARDRREIWSRVRGRLLLVATAVSVFWPWLSSSALAALSFVFPNDAVRTGWTMPGWTVLMLPVVVAGLMLLLCGQRGFEDNPVTVVR